jgi:putative transposase
MPDRDHLKRLPRQYYQNDAVVHWTITIRDRKQGWVSPVFFYRYRELLTHTLFRYGLVCPIFCLMPDHIHMVWMGLLSGSDQFTAMKHFRQRCNESLARIGFELQDQSYDHVLKNEELRESEFRNLCEYIARNPERAGLVGIDCYDQYPYSGCLIPGYPELRPFTPDFRDRLDKTIAHLRKHGFQQLDLPP